MLYRYLSSLLKRSIITHSPLVVALVVFEVATVRRFAVGGAGAEIRLLVLDTVEAAGR